MVTTWPLGRWRLGSDESVVCSVTSRDGPIMGPASRIDSNIELRRMVQSGAEPKVLRLEMLAAEREERICS